MYPKSIIVEKYDYNTRTSIWKIKVLFGKGEQWQDLTTLDFDSLIKAERYRQTVAPRYTS